MSRSRRARIAAAIFLACAVVGAPIAATANVAGQFRVGWYDALSNVQNPARIASNGMSMITAYHGEDAEPVKYLNAARAARTTVMAEIPENLVKHMDVQKIKAYVALYKDHAGLEGWHLADEPSVNRTLGPLTPDRAVTLYKAIKSVDPAHPVSITFASGEDARRYVPAMDVLQHDDYPFKALTREFANLERWKKYTFQMSSIARKNDLPFVPVLQAFGGSNVQPVMGYRAPTVPEMRYLVYASLSALADGLYFWTFYRRDPSWVNSTLKPLVEDLEKMQPALSAGYRAGVARSSNPAITATPFQDPGTGRWYVLAINQTDSSASGTLKFSDELSGKRSAREAGQATPIVDDKLTHSLSAYEVIVYTID